MKKLLKPRDVLLLGLTNALDLFEEIKDPFHAVSKSYDRMYGWVPDRFKKHHFNNLIWRTLKTGYIERIEKGGEIYLRITLQGENASQREFPLLHLQNKPWDGKWRIVMFDISEAEKKGRDYLRQKLKELGFGMLQESVFITPHDILRDFSEYVENIGLKESVDILEASYILGDQKKLIERIWKLEEMNELYLEIFQEARKIKSEYSIKIRGSVKQLNDNIGEGSLGEMKVREIRGKYLSVLLRDPFLPQALLPKGYLRDKLGKFLKKLF